MDKGTTQMDINAISGKRRLRRALVRRMFSLRHDKDGVVSIEAALLFPVMILLLLGMIDITMLLSVQRKATVATSAIVDLTTQQSATVNKTQLDQFIAAVDTILQPYTSQDIKVELFNYRPSGSNVTLNWQHARGSCGGMPSNMTMTELKKLTAEENDILVGRVCVNFTPIVGYVLGKTAISVDDAVAQRPRQGKTLNCSDCS
jgi:Flp pilus assembly protein TadG